MDAGEDTIEDSSFGSSIRNQESVAHRFWYIVFYCTLKDGSSKYSTLKLIPDFFLCRTPSSIDINTLNC